MTDYTELIKALRYCAENFGCPIECPRYSPADEGVRACVSRLEKDAADAIEALNRLVGLNTERCEGLRKQLREAQEQYEKHLNELEKELSFSESAYEEFQIVSATQNALLAKKLPKRGEWIVFNKQMLINLENAREQYKELGYPHRTELGLQCSNCRKVTYVDSGIKYEFCPHCGAKMTEVQE